MEIFDIITDIDGVLVNTPPWDPVPLAADGFYEFSSHCVKNFSIIVTAAWPARIVYHLPIKRNTLWNNGRSCSHDVA